MPDLEALTRLQNSGSSTGIEPVKVDVTGRLPPDDLLQRADVHVERHKQLCELIGAADQNAGDVQEHIAERVGADYRRRLDLLNEEFQPIREQLVSHLRSITFAEMDLRRCLGEVADELEELGFRSRLGEKNDVQLKRAAGAAEEVRAELEVKLGLIEGTFGSLARVLFDFEDLREGFRSESEPTQGHANENGEVPALTSCLPQGESATAPGLPNQELNIAVAAGERPATGCEESAAPPGPAWLSRTENDEVVTYRLEGAVFTLGRSGSNDAVIRGASVSRLHAVIRWLTDSFVIEDTSSAGGIEVNGEKVARHRLEDGDRIKVEASYFEFISPK